ncbi:MULTISPECIES: iron chelate uptake ABC transporter family permease subunit [Salipiger]|uniref:ABC ferric siderophore transporter, inner membrane subunit n=2 Tax=Salipiger TaxID=263377 RepID=Q0FR93_SALBH|nr:iron chelate uptake ABC transporter family permease subunit [Salipiger bermudensis]EAU46694.1 ABC ferric siderophore transporter, inner membrane subunit [Salipiger bermudensis HTCC2601]MBN9676780.1 iron chelate uptake ABC transporter family permease subunit [Salipiger bermudensis]MBR9890636.1 iron chelate uptake ABC transporter family permease subunit [bacterium]MCA1286664.1 iron chelate uptake ABC transporter family permease subunit [Salipiger bermudensis]
MAERRVLWLGLALLVLCGAFLAWQLRQPVGFILGLRAAKLGALVCVGAATGAATVLFQTVAGNRLLTPGLVGFDALFVLMQTLLVLLLGGVGAAAIPAGPRFLMEVAALGVASVALFGLLLRRDARDITRMILTGIILGVLLRGLSSMVQRLMDPSDFAVVQQAMFASFGRVDPQQLTFSAVVLLAAMAVALRMAPALDVAGLGRDTARGLGLNHDRVVMTALLLMAAMVSVSTALVGPITFLGLLTASLARQVTGSHRHAVLLPAAAILGALILVAGQFLFERLLGSQSALAVIVEFFGGLVFLFLVLKRRRR